MQANLEIKTSAYLMEAKLLILPQNIPLSPNKWTIYFDLSKKNKTISPLILSSICHYKIEFIHPFKDENGRIGRLWHTTLLYHWNPLFEFMPIESLIKEHQAEYYKILGQCDKLGESTLFIEFMLDIIRQTLDQFITQIKPAPLDTFSRLDFFKEKIKSSVFTRKDYVDFFKTISTAIARRDLAKGSTEKILVKTGNKQQRPILFYKDAQ